MSGREDCPITLSDSDDDGADVVTDSITITRHGRSPFSSKRSSTVAAILTSPGSSVVFPAQHGTNDSVLNRSKSSPSTQGFVNQVFSPQHTIHHHPQDVQQTHQRPSNGLSPRLLNPPCETQKRLSVERMQRLYETQIPSSDQGIQKRNKYAVGGTSSAGQYTPMMRQTRLPPEDAGGGVTHKEASSSAIGDEEHHTRLLVPQTVNKKLSEVVEYIVDRSYKKPGTSGDRADEAGRFRLLNTLSRASTPDSVIIESVEEPGVDSSKIPVTALQVAGTLQAQIKSPLEPVTPDIKILESFSLRDCPKTSTCVVEVVSERAAPFEAFEADKPPKPEPRKAIISPSVKMNPRVKPNCNANLLSVLCQKAFYQCCVGECEHSSVCPSEFEDHLHSMHAKAEGFLCVHCGDIATSAQLLIKHLHHHADQNSNLHCNYSDCKFVTGHPDSFTRHIYHYHEKEGPHLCLLCGEQFQTALDMLIHMKANFLNIVKCPHCSAKDVTKRNIVRHMNEFHPDKGKLVTVSRQIVCRERLRNSWPMLRNNGRAQSTNRSVCSSSVTQDNNRSVVEGDERSESFQKVDLTDGMSEDVSVFQSPSACRDGYVPIMSVRDSESGISVQRIKTEVESEGRDQHCDEMPVLEAYSEGNDQLCDEMPVLDQTRCATSLSDLDTAPRGANLSYVKAELEDMHCNGAVTEKDDIDSDHPVSKRNSPVEKDSTAFKSKIESGTERDETVQKSERFVSPSSDSKKDKSLQRVNACSKCDFYTTSVGQIYKHIREVHKIEDMFQCSECHGYLCQDDVIRHHVKYHPDADENYIPSALRHGFNIRYMKKSVYKSPSVQFEIGDDTSTSIDPVEDVTSNLMARLSEAKEGDKLKLTSFESRILNKIINERNMTTSIVSGCQKPSVSLVSKEVGAPVVKPKIHRSRKRRRLTMPNKGKRKRQRLETQEMSQEGTKHDRCQEELETFSGEADMVQQEMSEDDNEPDDYTLEAFDSVQQGAEDQTERRLPREVNAGCPPSCNDEQASPCGNSSAVHEVSLRIPKSPAMLSPKKYQSPVEPSHQRNQSPLRGPSLKCQSPVKGPSPIKYQSPVNGPSPIKYQSPVKGPSPIKYQSPVKGPSPIKHQSPVNGPSPIKYQSPVKGPSPIKYQSPKKENLSSFGEMNAEMDPSRTSHQTPKKEQAPVDEKSPVGTPLPMKHPSPIKVQGEGTGPNLTFSQVDFDDPSYEFRCKYCTYRRGSLEKFLHHTYYHFHYRPYACGFCDFKAFSHNRVLTHIKLDHPKKASKPVVKRVENEKMEARCQKTAMICFIPKHVEDVSLRRRVMMKKERQLQKKKIKLENREDKVKTSKFLQQKKQSDKLAKTVKTAKTAKTKLKTIKNSSVKSSNKAENEGSYLCPYCRTNRSLMVWTKLVIEICYHIHYKPLNCSYCEDLQSASMYCVQKHIEKVHPGKEVIAREEKDPHKEKRLKLLLQRSIDLSQKYRQELKRKDLSGKAKKVKKKHAGVKGALHPAGDGCQGHPLSASGVTLGNNSSNTKLQTDGNSTAVGSTSIAPSSHTVKTGKNCVSPKDVGSKKVPSSEDLCDTKSDSPKDLPASPEDMTVKKSHEMFKETRDDYGEVLYECLKCDYTIRNLKSMYTHSYKHQPKIFKCYYCDLTAYPRSTIVWHQKQHHFRLKPKVINLA